MNMNNWMAGLDSTKSIAGVSIPGTHESGAILDNGPKVQCQNLSITDQLAQGIRFLDIRLALRSADTEFIVTHGGYDQGPFAPVLSEVVRFLKQNPSEFVLMNVQKYEEYEGGSFSARFDKIVAGFAGDWFFEQRIPTVSEARHRIVLIRAYDDEAKAGWISDKGIPWNGFDKDGESDNEFFWTQNRWGFISEVNKMKWITQNLARAGLIRDERAGLIQDEPGDVEVQETLDPEKITLNFLSFSSAGGYWPVTGAKDINPLVFKEITENYKASRLGVMPMDFAGNTPGFIEEIISHNTFLKEGSY